MIENYQLDQFGVIHQIDFEAISYDQEYISYYESKSDRTIKLGYQRMGWILGLLNRIPESVLEIGYGTGTFIEAAKITGVSKCVGCDIADYPLPDGVEFMSWKEALEKSWGLVGMFDVLEHVPDLSFLRRLKARHLAIAVPYCRWREIRQETHSEAEADSWLQNWRMLLPNEHLHHFDLESLTEAMRHYGFKLVTSNTFEDGLRLREGESGPNVLSAFFERA